MKRFKNAFFFWLLFYPGIIILGWLFLGSLELLGTIKVHNKHLMPRRPKGLLLISNHPSFWEPLLLNYLFIKQATLSPLRSFPYSAPDLKNFDRWYWTTFKDRFIFFPRGNKRGCALALARAEKLLEDGRTVIIFPEGGRTWTNKSDKWLVSSKGKRLRPLKSGAARIALQSGCDVLPVWIKGAEAVMPLGSKLPRFWRKVEIRLGPAFRLENSGNKEDLDRGLEKFAENLLALADED